MKIHTKCPCHSKQLYSKCCKPFHDGQTPPSSTELMRSRYSAYALKNADYVMQTTHPESPLYKKNSIQWKAEIMNSYKDTTFDGLEILEILDGAHESFVTFKATLTKDGLDVSFKEKSRFLKPGHKWFYINGVLN